MSFATVASNFRTRMESCVLSPALPIVWQGQEFNPETQGGENGWIYFEVHLTNQEQVSFGASSNTHRDYGVAIANIVKPRGTKIGTIEIIADTIRSHFKPETVDGAHITSRVIGDDRLSTRDGRWQVTPLVMEFWSDRLEDTTSGNFLLMEDASLLELEGN